MGNHPDDLDWSDQGPRSRRFGDIYYSLQDGLAESRAVFLQGCGMPEAWSGRRHFTVGELGFGTGLNIVALLDLWRQTRSPEGRLSVFSIEGFPVERDEAARALSAWPELAPVADLILARWPARTPGFHRIDLPELGAVIDLAIGDAAWALEQWSGAADAWFMDGFSPALNPAMWSDTVLDAMTARSAPGARAATFTVAGAVRRGLAERGWSVDKRPGHGRKRERLEAVLPGPAILPSVPRVAILGAGIAGAAVARALIASGCVPVVVERSQPGAGASGLPAALATPRLDLGDTEIAALGAQTLIRAAALYDATEGAVTASGVIRLEHGARDAARFDKVAAQDIWPADTMVRLSATAAADRLGEASAAGGLLMAQARSVLPDVVLKAWLKDAQHITADVVRIGRRDDVWTLQDADGHVVAEADAVVLAGGWDGAARLFDVAPDLRMDPVRGQASWVEGVSGPAAAWGGYAAPTASGLAWGATHDRGQTTTEIRMEDEARNLSSLAEALPQRAAKLADLPVQSRASVRAVTPDRLPLCGAAPGVQGVFVLTGLGSRGFVLAPLLGEHITALVLDRPSPLPRDLAARIDPARKSVRVAA